MTILKAKNTFLKFWRLGFAKNTGRNKKIIEKALVVHYPNTPEGKWVKLLHIIYPKAPKTRWFNFAGRFYYKQTKRGYNDGRSKKT